MPIAGSLAVASFPHPNQVQQRIVGSQVAEALKVPA